MWNNFGWINAVSQEKYAIYEGIGTELNNRTIEDSKMESKIWYNQLHSSDINHTLMFGLTRNINTSQNYLTKNKNKKKEEKITQNLQHNYMKVSQKVTIILLFKKEI